MTAADALWLLVALAAVVGFLMLRALGRSARRMRRHLERRLVDALIAGVAYVVFARWRNRRRARPRPPVLEGDDIYRSCSLSLWQGDPARCRWCNEPLPNRSERWCTSACSRKARRNHVFGGAGGAREAALERDGDACVCCGERATVEHAIEVNHVTPCLGRHGQVGCWHHLDGLESLCHRHHRAETDRQRRNGDFGPRRRAAGWTT